MSSHILKIVLATGLLLAGQVGAENPNGSKLELGLAARSKILNIEDNVRFCVSIANNVKMSQATIYGELGWGYGGGLVLEVESVDGKEVRPKLLDDSHIIPSNLEKAEYFVTLQPGHSLGTCRSDRAIDIFRGPGKYKVHVNYRSPIPREFAQGKNFIALEDGWIESNSILVTVLP